MKERKSLSLLSPQKYIGRGRVRAGYISQNEIAADYCNYMHYLSQYNSFDCFRVLLGFKPLIWNFEFSPRGIFESNLNIRLDGMAVTIINFDRIKP